MVVRGCHSTWEPSPEAIQGLYEYSIVSSMMSLFLGKGMSGCDPKPEHKHDSQIPSTNGKAKIPPKHRAEPNKLKSYPMKEETHKFPNSQVPSS
ncbi:hypothetical protein O181_015043 [Austropuccinia psidii MF-1]|uniref:Uncharacterized protein n=1 Tax=Austropuccinia psidii MF-1 TaxID=1389203 RepID=A0A9Q3GPL2_9BASI|nr:hypothetical protein [Austropuccinia psidii MF-1]